MHDLAMILKTVKEMAYTVKDTISLTSEYIDDVMFADEFACFIVE